MMWKLYIYIYIYVYIYISLYVVGTYNPNNQNRKRRDLLQNRLCQSIHLKILRLGFWLNASLLNDVLSLMPSTIYKVSHIKIAQHKSRCQYFDGMVAI